MERLRSKLEPLSESRLDVLAAVVGLVLSVALLPLGFVGTDVLVRGVPVALGVGCLLYLFSSRTNARRSTSAHLLDSTSTRTTVFVSQVIPRLVVIGLAGLIVVAVTTGGRPLPFLVGTGIVGALIMVQIVGLEGSELDHRIVLAEIVALAFVVRYSALFTTPGFIGTDNWTHVTSYAAAIQNEGSLSAISGIKYYAAPFYHLLTVATAEILSVPLRTALYLGIGAVMPLSVLLIYVTARYVTDVQWALLATALFAVADYIIYWGLYVSTTSLGLVFFLVVLWLLTRTLYVDVGRVDFVLLATFAIVVALTHQVSAFITIVLLSTATLVVFCSRFVDGMALPNESRYLFGAFGAFFAFTMVQWALTPWMGRIFIVGAVEIALDWVSESVGFLNLVEDIPTGDGEGGEVITTGFVAQLAAYVDNLGFLLFLVIAVLGSLALLQRSRSVGTYLFIGAITAMMVFLLGLPLFGFRFLVVERWYAFVYAPMAIVGAVGIKQFVDHVPTRGAAVGLVVFLLLLSSSMAMAHPATIDDPTFEDHWQKWAYTAPEVAAGETLTETVPEEHEPIYTDNHHFRMLTRINEDPSERVGEEYVFSAYMFTVTDENHVDPDLEPVLYRAYQSEGYPVYLDSDGELTTGQLSADQVCPETRNHVYTAQDVVVCTSR